jgi:hypothetical protein
LPNAEQLATDLNEYLQYCWLAYSHEDFRLAPFHLLARTASFGFAGDAPREWVLRTAAFLPCSVSLNILMSWVYDASTQS